MTVRILQGDCFAILPTLPDESVHCVVTSPPYWGLRDYGVAGQLGLEATPAEYVEKMVAVFREVRRVLRDDGTLWCNMGDTYGTGTTAPRTAGKRGIGAGQQLAQDAVPRAGGMAKQLLGIPWRLAFALQADGWYLRQDIIWAKPNPMPESVRDRCTKSHEYIFLLSKRERYHFDADAIAEASAYPGDDRAARTDTRKAVDIKCMDNGSRARTGNPTGDTRNKRSVWTVATQPFSEAHFATFPPALIEPCILAGTSSHGCCPTCLSPWVLDAGRPCEQCGAFIAFQGKSCEACGHVRDWKAERGVSEALAAADWSAPGRGVPRKLGESGKQGAVPPQERMDRGWKQSCSCEPATPLACTVLDPFGGAGTTGLVADRLGRDAILVELNAEYAAMAERRIRGDSPLFAEVTA